MYISRNLATFTYKNLYIRTWRRYLHISTLIPGTSNLVLG